LPLSKFSLATTVLAAHHIKSLLVVVYIAVRISAEKHMIFDATSRYNAIIFHVAPHYKVILQQTPHFLITPHQKTLKTFFPNFNGQGPLKFKINPKRPMGKSKAIDSYHF
jgi:hypothetical protein